MDTDRAGGSVPVIDATNPIAEGPPARFVKAFSCVRSALMVNPKPEEGPPTMFICGDDAGARKEVSAILDQFGWEVEDRGGVEAARAIEPLCMLWCIPGFTRGRWTHAFRLLGRELRAGRDPRKATHEL